MAHPAGLQWPPLLCGRLVKRYKRFLADVLLNDGRTVTAHCPNSGSMAGCSESGRPVYLSESPNPRRKLKYTWEMIAMPTSLVGVNTLVPNRLVARAAGGGRIPELVGYEELRTEVTVNRHTRLDLKLSGGKQPDCFVEVKNCTLVENGIALFPDAPTIRGRKHLLELIRLKETGARAVIFFLVQRTDARSFAPATGIDPEYSHLLRRAADAGVDILAYDTAIDLQTIRLNHSLPFCFDGPTHHQ